MGSDLLKIGNKISTEFGFFSAIKFMDSGTDFLSISGNNFLYSGTENFNKIIIPTEKYFSGKGIKYFNNQFLRDNINSWGNF